MASTARFICKDMRLIGAVWGEGSSGTYDNRDGCGAWIYLTVEPCVLRYWEEDTQPFMSTARWMNSTTPVKRLEQSPTTAFIQRTACRLETCLGLIFEKKWEPSRWQLRTLRVIQIWSTDWSAFTGMPIIWLFSTFVPAPKQDIAIQQTAVDQKLHI